MGEAKRRKQILGNEYGQLGTVNHSILTAKKKNDAELPSKFLPDFGLEVAAQVSSAPIHLTVVKADKFKVMKQALDGILAITFVPREFGITRAPDGVNPPMVIRETMMALEIYNPDMSKVDTVVSALKSGIDVQANWSKRFFSNNPIYKELVVPIHLMPYEEDRLGLQHIADYT